MRNRGGFTLIEALVVTAVIAVLATVLMPALARARRQARRVSSLSNERNIGLHRQMLQVDNAGYFPTTDEYVNGWNRPGTAASPDDLRGGYCHWTAIIGPEGARSSTATRACTPSTRRANRSSTFAASASAPALTSRSSRTTRNPPRCGFAWRSGPGPEGPGLSPSRAGRRPVSLPDVRPFM